MAPAQKIKADAIDGLTITGATVQTGKTGNRLVMNSTGLRSYDGAGNVGVDLSGDFSLLNMTTAWSYAGFNSEGVSIIGEDGTDLSLTSTEGLCQHNPPTTTTTADACWTSPSSNGYYYLKRKSSLKRLKVAYESIPEADTDLLGLQPRRWFDRAEVIAHGLDPATATAEECLAAGLKWIPGFIAEEVEAISPLFCTYDQDEEGKLGGVAYDRLSAALLALAQRQAGQLAALEDRISAIESKLT